MSSPMSSSIDTPPLSITGIQRVNQPMNTALTIGVSARPEGPHLNFRPPVVPNEDNAVTYHYLPQYAPSLAPHFLNYGANRSTNFFGFGITNVANWLQHNPQQGFANFASVGLPPPTPPTTRPSLPFAYPSNENPNASSHGFNYIAHQQNLFGNGPSFKPRSSPVNIYRNRGQVPGTGHLDTTGTATNSIIIIPDDSPPQTTSAAQSSPQRTNLLVPRDESDQSDQTLQDKRPSERPEEEHKCHFCNKKFESGKALGGHMSSHEKKRKREQTKVGKNFMASGTGSTADGACRRRADRTEGKDELDATDEEDEEKCN